MMLSQLSGPEMHHVDFGMFGVPTKLPLNYEAFLASLTGWFLRTTRKALHDLLLLVSLVYLAEYRSRLASWRTISYVDTNAMKGTCRQLITCIRSITSVVGMFGFLLETYEIVNGTVSTVSYSDGSSGSTICLSALTTIL